MHGSTPATGQTINHNFIDNGTYNSVLTVTDKDSGVTTQTVIVKVDNVSPAIISITKPNQINEGQPTEFKAIAKAGETNDTLTYVWNFGDNSSPLSGQNAAHIFTDNGNYNVVLTVTDKDGGATKESIEIKVENTIVIEPPKPTAIKPGVFTVGSDGQISIDYLFDGGYYQAQMSIFSLDGMENLEVGSI
jgi:PKD repeat protein